MHILIMIIYIAFVTFGLPASLLGATWPSMYQELQSSLAFAGVLSFTMAFTTAISSRYANIFVKKYGPGHTATYSMLIFFISVLGFALSHNIILFFLCCIPYGIASGGLNATINNYVATHYKSQYVSWLHAMWGLGAAAGPYIMRYTFSLGANWHIGYLTVSIIILFTFFLMMITLSWWKDIPEKKLFLNKLQINRIKKEKNASSDGGFLKTFGIKGASQIVLMFFCYCAIEQTISLWATSYFVFSRNVDPKIAAGYGGLFFIGLTVGRIISGFISMKLSDNKLIRLGEALMLIGVGLLFVNDQKISLLGLIILGVGCAPIFPTLLHLTAESFEKHLSEGIIITELTVAQLSTSFMPPIFGLLMKDESSKTLLPVFLLVFLGIMIMLHIVFLIRVNGRKNKNLFISNKTKN